MEVDDNGSSRNRAEASATSRHLQAISEYKGAKMPTTVLTFYLAHRQRSFVGRMDVELATIDGFQGRERDRVILNLVASSPQGFLAEGKWMNVALSSEPPLHRSSGIEAAVCLSI